MAASFMARKKKYKFQVEVCLEELLEVPFVSAVLFAKLRLLDGGGFQDHSSRQEVRDHRVQWNATFAFPCKMMANATTGVMERCALRISVRKESKGGRSFHKLGFVDLNLAEFAGAGLARRKALLEGYDARHRQDNSMLKYRIQMNMISGDILFKAPSPSLKHKDAGTAEDEAGSAASDQRPDDFSGGSLAGSVASGSSGFGSLPKKRPQLLTSELVAGQPQPQQQQQAEAANVPDVQEPNHQAQLAADQAPGHSRNSSNTSQMSRASGYASLHSRQSSSGGDSGGGHTRKRQFVSSTPNRLPEGDEEFHTPRGVVLRIQFTSTDVDTSGEEYRTPDSTPAPAADRRHVLRKSPSAGVVVACRAGPDDVPAFLTPGMARKGGGGSGGGAAGLRATSLSSLDSSRRRSFPHHHRKFLEAPPAANDCSAAAAEAADGAPKTRRQSVAVANPSGGGGGSEPGSLERPKSAAPSAKRAGNPEEAPGRVEITRVDTDVVIEELLKSTNLEPQDDSAETSGLQLFIARDGTAALGNHEVKQRMGAAGAQLFQQVVVDAQDR